MRFFTGFLAGLLLAAAGYGALRLIAAPENEAVVETEGDYEPLRIITRHKIEIGGKTLNYTATAGETFLANAAGSPIGSLFSFAYVKDDPIDSSRPVLFIFNGGPGSSSLWLHMGAIGPKRVVLDQEVNPRNVPPFGVVANPHSVLDVADLVFIDPIGAGFSRAIGEGKSEEFWGVDEDANSVAQFIELWLSQNGRWNSPKYILGESYGTVRAAVLPRALMGGPFYTGVMRGLTVDGIILLGTTLNGRLGQGEPEKPDELRAALVLPGLAAAAWYHGKIDREEKSLEALYSEATTFAKTDYVGALRKAADGKLAAEERAAVVNRLVAYTGLPEDAFKEGISLSPRPFAKQLLKEEGLEIGMYDSRYTLPLANSGNDPVADDPAMGQYVPGFVAAFHQMLHDDLKVEIARPYGAIVWKDLLSKWNWKRTGVEEGQSYAVDLAWAMRRNPSLRILVASGYFDLVTTPVSAEQSLAEVEMPRDRITLRKYESGHMLYLGGTAPAFADDLRAFIKAAPSR